MKKLKDKFEQEKKALLQDADQIGSASDYSGGYLRHGTCCDSSERSTKRMEWVHLAQKEFLEKNKRQILKRAAEMCREYAEE
jgi:hypothetical protein